MKIVYCIDYYHPHIGGGETLFQYLAETMAEEGHKVHVVTLGLPNSPKKEIHHAVTIHRVTSLNRFSFAFQALPTLWRVAHQADIIHTSTLVAFLPAKIVSFFKRIPCILSLYELFGTLWFRFLGFLPALISYYGERFLTSLRYSAVITPSRYSANSVRISSRAVTDQTLFMIPLGVDTQEWNYTDVKKQKGQELIPLSTSETKRVLFFGRSGVSKGLEYLVEAFQYITDPAIELLVISPLLEPRLKKIQQRAQTLGLDSRVSFHDSLPRADLISVACTADCIVIPSLAEGFGFVAVEAATLKKPLVVSDCASLPEVVSGSVVFVRPGDPADIARGIMVALDGKAQNIPPKHFPWAETITRHRQIYERVSHV